MKPRDFGLEAMSSPWKAEVWDEKRGGSIIGSNSDTKEGAIAAAKIYRDKQGYSGGNHSVFVVGKNGQILGEDEWRK